jgi:uncharacterized protein (DUF2164 family)
MSLERRRFRYNIDKDPNPEQTIADSLDIAADYWREEAGARFRLLEQDISVITPREKHTAALVGGLVEFLQKKYDTEADDLVINDAIELIKEHIGEKNQGACATQVAVALADRDRLDAAISFLPGEGGPVPEEYEYHVHLALAEAHAREDGNEDHIDPLIFEELMIAYVSGADIESCAELYEKVFQTAVETRSI